MASTLNLNTATFPLTTNATTGLFPDASGDMKAISGTFIVPSGTEIIQTEHLKGYVTGETPVASKMLSQFLGESTTHTALSSVHILLDNLNTAIGGIGTFYLNSTGTNCSIEIRGPGSTCSGVVWLQNKQREVKQLVKNNLLIKVHHRQKALNNILSKEELRARDSLRDMLTEREWRRYVTNGFIMIKGSSGYWYQIFASQDRIRVYKDNKHTHSICLHTDRSCPPTDHVINMKILIEIDERSVWSEGNITNHEGKSSFLWNPSLLASTHEIHPPRKEGILDIYKSFKKGGNTQYLSSNSDIAICC